MLLVSAKLTVNHKTNAKASQPARFSIIVSPDKTGLLKHKA